MEPKLTNVRKAIENAKRKLNKQWNVNPVENFGQDVVRKLEDRYIDISSYTSNMNSIRNILNEFDNWCMNYSN